MTSTAMIAYLLFVAFVGPALANALEDRWKRLRRARGVEVHLRREVALLVGLIGASLASTAWMARHSLLTALFGGLVLVRAHVAYGELRRLAKRVRDHAPGEEPGDLDDPQDLFWLLVSWVALEPEAQLAHLTAPLPSRDSPDALKRATNPLLCVEYGLRAFGLCCDRTNGSMLKLFRDAVERHNPERQPRPGIYCREEFPDGAAWRELRSLARSAIAESGLAPQLLPERLDVRSYIEPIEIDDGM
jgi:hypothetical protein